MSRSYSIPGMHAPRRESPQIRVAEDEEIAACGAAYRSRGGSGSGAVFGGRNRLGKLRALGTTSYIDAAVHASVTADFVYDGVNVVVDGNMEAVGIAAWTVISGAAAKVATLPLLPGSTQQLQINGATPAYVRQLVPPASCRSNVTGYYRTTGTASSRVTANGTAHALPAALAWTAFSFPNDWGTGGYSLWYNLDSALGNVEFDNASIIRLPIASAVSDQISGGPGVAQATAANRPTYLPLAAAVAQGLTCPCWQFDGTAQYFVTGFTPADNWGVSGWFYVDSIAAGVRYFSGAYSGATTRYSGIYQNGATLGALCGLAASDLAHGTALTVGWHYLAMGRLGAALVLWLDGIAVTNALATAPPALSLYLNARKLDAGTGSYRSGYVANFTIWNHLPTTDQIVTAMTLTRPRGV